MSLLQKTIEPFTDVWLLPYPIESHAQLPGWIDTTVCGDGVLQAEGANQLAGFAESATSPLQWSADIAGFFSSSDETAIFVLSFCHFPESVSFSPPDHPLKMLEFVTRFSNDALGVEKSLKFLQSTSQIAATIGYLSPNEAAQWLTAKNQFALARRYLRLFKWIDCWNLAHNQYQSFLTTSKTAKQKLPKQSQPQVAQNNIHFLLIVSKWSLLGMYLFLEMFTIVDAVLGTWRPWAVTMQTESLKFWFYALSVSVALDLYELLFVYSDSASSQSDQPAYQKEATSTIIEKTGDKGVANEPPQSKAGHAKSAKRRAVYRQLAIDSCDLLIPGAAVGLLQLDPVTVGVAGTVSALLGGSDVWQRVNA